ncbi:hypothetical protein [Psychroflexus sp. ALD_RP9]|uniref:hypothetical protein n=1 Tax=Psychroflexus sp. ALD_RP9 TaxID=2777186 RepID=UPI001A8CBE94|nr:hypothetical protein [Psychroflexus sp. ALD_RP9]QSS96855.1 hypothetical protein IMZ30_10445 [Psychroflexus sp. ALD_RP9]
MDKHKATYQKKSGFKVPDNYFNEFKISELNLIEKKVFNIPDNYFEELEIKLPQESKVINLRQRVLLISSSVAAILIIALIALYPSRNNQKLDSFSNVEQSEIEDYLETELENPEDYIDDNTPIDFNNFEQNQLSSEEIAKYLGDNLYEEDFINN